MDGYPVTVRIEVRWRDVDALGHLNNAVCFTYFEVARGRYFDEVLLRGAVPGLTCVLVSARCDFARPVRYGEAVEVGIRIPAVGRTSFDFEYEVRVVGEDRVAARGRSTQVLYDGVREEKVPFSEEWLGKVAWAQGQPPRRKPTGLLQGPDG